MILEYRGSSCGTAVYNQSTNVDVFFNRSILAAFQTGSSHDVTGVPVFAVFILVCFLLVMFLKLLGSRVHLAFTDFINEKVERR
jgi:hypothetical protein